MRLNRWMTAWGGLCLVLLLAESGYSTCQEDCKAIACWEFSNSNVCWVRQDGETCI